MTTLQAATETTIAPLLDEMTTVQAEERDGGLAPLGAADRVALGAARHLLAWSRHHREHVDRRAAADAAGVEAGMEHAFEHRIEAGLPR